MKKLYLLIILTITTTQCFSMQLLKDWSPLKPSVEKLIREREYSYVANKELFLKDILELEGYEAAPSGIKTVFSFVSDAITISLSTITALWLNESAESKYKLISYLILMIKFHHLYNIVKVLLLL